jgi:hypothetical protein
MGSIRRVLTERTSCLEAEHLIGRAVASSLRLAPRYVSVHHAALRWADDHWELKDLGSRNGTFLDGQRLRPGEGYPVDPEAIIAFGNLTDERWQMVDSSAPLPMAVPVDGGEPVPLEGGLIALPSSDDPRVTIYRTSDGSFVIETPDEPSARIDNLQTFSVLERPWRFSCVEDLRTASVTVSSDTLTIRQIELSFSVSADEEHVQIHMVAGGRTVDMRSRNHNYLLLTLARARMKDREQGIAAASRGWLHHDDLRSGTPAESSSLNLEVYRIRKHFLRAGVTDGANIIERRPGAGQLRIGSDRLTIHRA